MFEQINKLRIQGCSYEEETTLELLSKRVNVLYGRNGSGKSTIAKAFRQIAEEGNHEVEIVQRPLRVAQLEGDDAEIHLSDEDKGKIFVFDQDFIDKYVRLGEGNNGLSTIVMFGNQGDLADKITACEEKIEESVKRMAVINEKISLLAKDKQDKRESFKRALRENGGWVEMNKDVTEKNKNVTDKVMDMLMALEVKDDYNSLRLEYEKLLELYRKTRNVEEIGYRVSKVGERDLSGLQEELRYKLLSPQLSEENKQLITIIEGLGVVRLNEMRETFQDPEARRCPYCMQELNDSHKRNLMELINVTLNKEVEKYTAKINRLKEDLLGDVVAKSDVGLEMDMAFKVLFVEYRKAVMSLNKQLKKVRGVVENRLNQIYQAYDDDITQYDIAEGIATVNGCIDKINDKIDEFNEAVRDKNHRLKRLQNLIDQMAVAMNKELIKEYDAKEDEIVKLEELLRISMNIKSGDEQKLIGLKGKQRDVKVAMNEINKTLMYVFGSEDRLKLKMGGNGLYEIMVNGRSVGPKNVSTGERNIIALCYFFAHVYTGEMNNWDKYKQERLIVIDDPISSFDMDNKVGMLSFLNYEMHQICRRNTKEWDNHSKMLIMSHDRATINNLLSIAYTLNDTDDNDQNNLMVISNHKIEWIGQKSSEYVNLMKIVYGYAISEREDPIVDSIIANSIRRLLEAYATFNYQCKASQMFRDRNIIKSFPPEMISYFRNSMMKSLTNDGSHAEDAVNTMMDMADIYTPADKRKAAKETLIFLYTLNPMHIVKCLVGDNRNGYGEKSVQEQQIDQWIGEMFPIEHKKRMGNG